MVKNYLLLLSLCVFSSANSQIINFPDANFKARLLKSSYTSEIAKDNGGNKFKIDYNNDGEIELNEALNVYQLNIDQPYFDEQIITDLSGINNFKNLTVLYCRSNKITDFDLTGLNNLKDLDCNSNLLTKLDLSYLSKLQSLNCNYNQINKIELKGFKNLLYLACASNKLTNIDASLLTKLETFAFDSNLISSIDLSNNLNLQTLECSSNKLTNLDISSLKKLNRLVCSYNEITQLDLSAQQNLTDLQCFNSKLTSIDLSNFNGYIELRNNDLRSIYLKNGFTDNYGMILDGNPNLTYICCDDNETENLKLAIGYLGYANCVVNSYCTFDPGGTYYTILGNQKLDYDNNGCDDSDSDYTNLNFNITNGIIKGNIISDASGNYKISVGEGIHTITPILENPNYFEVSPESVSVTFPNKNNTFRQNFCVSPKGIHQDLEIAILEMLPARPGFDAKYRIIYKNKGTQTMSGSVILDFNDVVLDFVSSIPVITNQSLNKLVWDYINLKPFETREIEFTLNVNSPMETPAVNINDRLSFNALITPIIGDEKPVDNSFAMRQIVVGSFDPNDKKCLEGEVITPELIGEYVHYLIRFENTGTYPAENIVVKDMIDLSKFDISTLVPTNSSHSYTTKISDGNRVEFIFEKINLPFDDANNDGYIAFKIKTLPTLQVGDSFANEANIYFDYNFPILTNKATSTFKTLGTQDFEFSNYFSVYPNPVKETLNITAKNSIELKSIAIYDILGQLVIAVPNAENISKIDVSNLRTGNYILKVKTDNGTSSAKFIKK